LLLEDLSRGIEAADRVRRDYLLTSPINLALVFIAVLT